MFQIFILIVGFVLLVKGAEFLVVGASSLAKRFKISDSIVGVTLVAFGTSVPELFISIQASVNNNNDMILGNIIGTNITNLLLILGFSSILKNIVFDKENKKIEIPFMIFIVVLFYYLANINSVISRLDSIILLVFLVGFIYYIFKNTKKTRKSNKKVLSWFITSVYILFGISFLILGSRFVVDSSSNIASMFNISNSIISLTIVALGTSLPELITYIVASLKGENDMAIGNVIGSNIMNISLVLGVSGLFKPIVFNPLYNEQLIILFISSFLLLLFAYLGKKNTMTKYNGLLYIIIFILYLILLFN